MSDGCPRCGTRADFGASTCAQCGAALSAATSIAGGSWGGLQGMQAAAPAAAASPAVKLAGSGATQRRVARKQHTSRDELVSRPSANHGTRKPAADGGGRVVSIKRSQGAAPPAAAADDPLGVFDTGMVDLGGAMSAGGIDNAPSLDVLSMPPPEVLPDQIIVEQKFDESRDEKATELAGFGARPTKLHQSVPYFLKVMFRKRALEVELGTLTTHRMRLDTQAEEALCSLGEALYKQRQNPKLKALAQQLRVVAETSSQVGAKEAASLQSTEQHRKELEKLGEDVAKVERGVAPLRKRETELEAKLELLRNQVKRKEALVKKAEAEIKALRASTDVTAIDRIAALEAEREAHFGDIQSRNVELLPLQEDMSALAREIAKRMSALSSLHEEERRHTQAMERENERHRITTGGARSELKDALRSLAHAAQRAKLVAAAPAQASAASETEARAKSKRSVEEVYRAALQSYDHEAYKRGMYILVGGTVGVLVVFAGLIVF